MGLAPIIISITIYLCVPFYVSIKSHVIILDELKNCVNIWICHSSLVFIILTSLTIGRICHDSIFDNNVVVKLFSCFMLICKCGESILTMAFGYFKIRFYQNLSRNDSQRPMLFKIFKFAILLWTLIILPSGCIALYITSGSRSRHGSHIFLFGHALILSNLIVYLILSFLLLYILHAFEKIKMELPEKLESQISQNKKSLSFLCTSSFSCYVITGLFWFILKMEFPIQYVVAILDASINDLIMFRLIYCNDAWQDMRVADLNENCEQDEEEPSPEPSDGKEVYYVIFDGFHPFPVQKHILDKHGLWGAVIVDRLMLKQIKRYNRSNLTCIPSLNLSSTTIDEFTEQIEAEVGRMNTLKKIFYE